MRVSGQLVGSLVNGRLELFHNLDSGLSRLLQFLAHPSMQQAEGLLIVAGQRRRAYRACVSYRPIEESRRRFDFISAFGALPEGCRTHYLVIGASFFQFSVDYLFAIGVCLCDKLVQKQTVSIRV